MGPLIRRFVVITVLASVVASAPRASGRRPKRGSHRRVVKPSGSSPETPVSPVRAPASVASPPPAVVVPPVTPPVRPARAVEPPAAAVVATAPPTTSQVLAGRPTTLELLAVELDGGVGARRLSYGVGATNNLRSADSPAVAVMGFHAALYPLARTGRAGLEGLGVVAALMHSVAAESQVGDTGRRVDEAWLSWDLSVHERLRLGHARHAPWLGVRFGYGQLSYAVEDGGRLIGGMPSVEYRYVRPGLDLRIDVGRVTLAIAAGYRAVLSAGYLGDHFPDGKIHGVDVDAAVHVGLPRGFRIGLRAQFIDHFYLPHANPTDPFYAPSATDRYLSGTLALAWAPR